jgi:putative sigma-54 modulation protein
MIKLQVSGRNYELSDKITGYVNDKIGALDKYLPRNNRQASGSVTLETDVSGREDNQCVCEVVIRVPGSVLQAKEATVNMYAAIDIVEAKIKSQILKYKDKHSPKLNQRQRWLNKMLRREIAE